MEFTVRYISSLKPETKMYQKREGKGFGIRVLPSGHKIWIFTYTFDGRRRQMNLGSFPDMSLSDARAAYSAAFAKLHDKENPRDPQEERDQKHEIARKQREEHRKHPTIKELIAEYLENFAMEKKKTWLEDKRILEKDVLPVWGDRKARSIDRRDVLLLINGIKARGNAITLNTFKIIRRMFKYALKQEIVEQTPCYAFEKDDELPVVPSRERVLTEEEVKVLWSAVDRASMTQDTKRVIKLILVTCQRPGEVVSMHRSQINGRWWEFTPKLTKVTKEKPRPQRIYLTDMALELIGDKEGYIFESPTTGRHIEERSVAYAIRRNLKNYTRRKPSEDPNASDVPKMVRVKEEKKMDINHFTPHDLRRTGATLIASLGFSDEIVDAVLAHLKKGTIKVYNRHQYDKEKQQAMEALERKILSLVCGKKQDNVTNIQEGRKKRKKAA